MSYTRRHAMRGLIGAAALPALPLGRTAPVPPIMSVSEIGARYFTIRKDYRNGIPASTAELEGLYKACTPWARGLKARADAHYHAGWAALLTSCVHSDNMAPPAVAAAWAQKAERDGAVIGDKELVTHAIMRQAIAHMRPGGNLPTALDLAGKAEVASRAVARAHPGTTARALAVLGEVQAKSGDRAAWLDSRKRLEGFLDKVGGRERHGEFSAAEIFQSMARAGNEFQFSASATWAQQAGSFCPRGETRFGRLARLTRAEALQAFPQHVERGLSMALDVLEACPLVEQDGRRRREGLYLLSGHRVLAAVPERYRGSHQARALKRLLSA